MEEALELLDLVGDFGLEGVITWLLRLIGLVLVLAGVGVWLLTESGLLVLPALLIGVGVVLIVVPGVLFMFAEFA